ncbi:hypothetical protein BGZ60DRAFT_408207 [Tricladium varicosporioides]|nr:hypothetical protein BGZ60DRAFT_408207 [Hymenoscyphus varicosporioides]
MRYNILIPLVLFAGVTTPEPIPFLKPRGDGHCDHSLGTQNNPACPAGACCSTENWCGYGTAWCGPNPGPTPNDGSCDHNLGTYNNPACPSGACCSSYNWCGYGAAWCGGPVPGGDGSCDPKNGKRQNPACPPGACCSAWGWCGYGQAWCA